jgi:hypothetical protein
MTIAMLAPLGMPVGVDPRTWRKAIEARLNELLDQSFALITALDMMEVDPDFELTGDEEPSLGWGERGPSTISHDAANDDREAEDEHGGDILDEPHDEEPDMEQDYHDADLFIWGGNEKPPRGWAGPR